MSVTSLMTGYISFNFISVWLLCGIIKICYPHKLVKMENYTSSWRLAIESSARRSKLSFSTGKGWFVMKIRNIEPLRYWSIDISSTEWAAWLRKVYISRIREAAIHLKEYFEQAVPKRRKSSCFYTILRPEFSLLSQEASCFCTEV